MVCSKVSQIQVFTLRYNKVGERIVHMKSNRESSLKSTSGLVYLSTSLLNLNQSSWSRGPTIK